MNNRGHIHIITIFALLLLAAAAWIVVDWRDKLYALHDEVVKIENHILLIEKRLRDVELKSDVAALAAPAATPVRK